MTDPYRHTDNWTTCPKCDENFGWNDEDGLKGQTCSCDYVFSSHKQERLNYARDRFKELIAGTESDHLHQEDGVLHGTCIADHGETWEHWSFHFGLTDDEIKEMKEEYEGRDDRVYRGPGRAFSGNSLVWELPGNCILITQSCGLDI
jgi:hypothetical protein